MLFGGSRRWRGPGVVRMRGDSGWGRGIVYFDVPLNDGDAASWCHCELN